MKIEHDLHIHTYLSSCCSAKEQQTPRKIVSLAEQMGMQAIGFADHLWMNPAIAPNAWYLPQDERQIERLRQDLSRIETSVKIRVGCEAETMAPGKFSITREFAESLDFVLLSCSHIHMADGTVEQPKSHAPRDVAELLLKLFLSGVQSGLPTSIAHPFGLIGVGPLKGLYEPMLNSISDAELSDAFHVAAENRVAIEINAAAVVPGNMQPDFSLDTPVRMITLAKQAGCKFTFGSDAHDPAGQQAIVGMQLIVDRTGITEYDMLQHR